MIRKFVYFIFVATAASRALEEQSNELFPEFPILPLRNLTTSENETSELVNPINNEINRINEINDLNTKKTDEYFFYNYINVPDLSTINTTKSLININSTDGIIGRLTGSRPVIKNPNYLQKDSMPSAEGINQFNGTTIETIKLINSINDTEFSRYENEIWSQTINELEKINKGLNKYNVPLIRTKRDPKVNGTVRETNNVTVLKTLNGLVSGKINANFFETNNETVIGILNGTVLEAANGMALGTFNGVIVGTINRTASESIDRMVLRTIDGTVLGTDNRTVLGAVIGLDKGTIMRKPKRPVSWVSENENDRTEEEVLDENIHLIRESVLRRLGLTIRKKRFNNITELFNEFLGQQNDDEEEEEGDEDEDIKEDDDEVYSYSID